METKHPTGFIFIGIVAFIHQNLQNLRYLGIVI